MGSSSPSPSFRPASPADMRLSPVLTSVIAAANSAPGWNVQFAQVENYLQFFREWDKALLLHSKCSNISFRQLTCSRFLLNAEAAAQMNDSQLQVMIRLLHFIFLVFGILFLTCGYCSWLLSGPCISISGAIECCQRPAQEPSRPSQVRHSTIFRLFWFSSVQASLRKLSKRRGHYFIQVLVKWSVHESKETKWFRFMFTMAYRILRCSRTFALRRPLFH